MRKVIERFVAVIACFIYEAKNAKSFKSFARKQLKKAAPTIITFLIGALVMLTMVRTTILKSSMVENNDIPEEEVIVQEEPEIVVEEIEVVEEVDPIKAEAEAIAKVLYGTAKNNSESGKKLVVWCIINRVESSLYPNTVEEVCSQDSQWMGYSDKNPIMQDMYDLAYGILSSWHSGGYRTIGPDYIYMTWSSSGISLRTSFVETKSTKYIYE